MKYQKYIFPLRSRSYQGQAKIKNFAFCFVILHFALCILNLGFVDAQGMQSPGYKLEESAIKVGAKEEFETGYDVGTVFGQEVKREFNKKGYVMIAHKKGEGTALSVQNTTLDFDSTAYDTAQSKEILLRLRAPVGAHYEVVLGQESGLLAPLGSLIEETSCDRGGQTCYIDKAALWISKRAFGYGYTIKGQGVPQDFKSTSYYRPFATLGSEVYQTILAGDASQAIQEAHFRMKLNIPSSQEEGTYQNVIHFIGIPSY